MASGRHKHAAGCVDCRAVRPLCTVQLGDVQSITREVVQDSVQEQGEALYLLAGSLPSVDFPHPKTHVTETSGAGDFVDLNLLSAFKHVWDFLKQTVADTPGASCIGLLNATRHVLIAPGP